jgi:integrase
MLTVKRVAKLNEPGRYGDGHGLYLQINPNGVKSWLLRYERSGKERWLGLGPIHTIDLAEARERARRARQQLLDGIDPIDAKKAQRAAAALEAAKSITFEDAARQYYAAHEGSWSNAKHRQQFLHTMRDYVLPKIGRLSVAAIDIGQVLRCIEPIWHDKAPTASRVRARIESVLDWATARQYRQGDNPARWKGHIENLLPAPNKIARTEHHAALPYAELPALMAALAERPVIGTRALEFLILTAARAGEVVGATWDEIDFNTSTWTIPAKRMKASREHRVPLSQAAMALLRSLPREEGNPHVFIGVTAGSSISRIAMHRTLRRERANITVHGFRSTFSTWAHETTAFPGHVIEMALAHNVGSAVERAYRRGDLFEKRRKLMADWARYCTTQPAEGANVVAINR